MNGFAQRLVARSAGQPAGLPLLMPRPASRFETSEPPVLDEVAETAAPVETARVEDTSSNHTHIPPASQPQGRTGESPKRETTDVGSSIPAQRPQPERAPVMSAAGAPDQPLPIASPQSPEHVDIAALHVQPAAKAVSERPSVTRGSEKSPVFSDQAMAAPLPPIAVADMPLPPIADMVRPEQAVAPAISIGRIEVQFIAPERPVAAPRPEPQRTRGFDAYARARRGMPR